MSLDNQETTQDFTSKTLTWFGAYFISFVGLLHLLLSGEHFGYAVYLGLLFLANFAVSAVAALGILWTGRRWAWLLGAVVAGTAFIGFLVSRVFGLPKFPEAAGQWFNFGGWMAVGFELAFLAAVPLVLTRGGRKLVEKEQHRIDAERLPPARQETPEHLDLMEEEMRDIRNRMAPDIRDLGSHLEPSALGERSKQSVRARASGFLRKLRERGRY